MRLLLKHIVKELHTIQKAHPHKLEFKDFKDLGSQASISFPCIANKRLTIKVMDMAQEESINVTYSFEVLDKKKVISSKTYAFSDVIRNISLPGFSKEEEEALKPYFQYYTVEGKIKNRQNKEKALTEFIRLIVFKIDLLKQICIQPDTSTEN